jgi:RNA polymerase sigma factor (TIGR02999 family)
MMVESSDTPGPLTLSSPERLLALYYQDLRKIAQRILHHDDAAFLLQPTELAHEAAMRLMKLERMDWQSVTHFLATAARVMRQALIDEVRRALAQKRRDLPLLTAWPDAAPTETGVDLEALDQALTRLEAISPERARVVELRLFAGLSIKEIATVQGISERTVKRQWQVARIWLTAELHST